MSQLSARFFDWTVMSKIAPQSKQQTSEIKTQTLNALQQTRIHRHDLALLQHALHDGLVQSSL